LGGTNFRPKIIVDFSEFRILINYSSYLVLVQLTYSRYFTADAVHLSFNCNANSWSCNDTRDFQNIIILVKSVLYTVM